MGEVSRNCWEEYKTWLHREEQRKLTQQRIEGLNQRIDFAMKLRERRNQFNKEADEFVGLESQRDEDILRMGRIHEQSYWNKDTRGWCSEHDRAIVHITMDCFTQQAIEPNEEDYPPNAKKLIALRDAGKLNTWEQNFVRFGDSS